LENFFYSSRANKLRVAIRKKDLFLAQKLSPGDVIYRVMLLPMRVIRRRKNRTMLRPRHEIDHRQRPGQSQASARASLVKVRTEKLQKRKMKKRHTL
jgi:hypothetical protein